MQGSAVEAYVARQPILDGNKKLFGYELLFRKNLKNYIPNEIDGDMATSKLLSSSLITVGIEKITGGKKAFINFTQNLLEDKYPLLFPAQTTVIEILETVKPGPSLIAACKSYSQKGYLLVLDDFVLDETHGGLISLADIIKIDFRANSIKKIKEMVEVAKKKDIKLIAEKVETIEDFNTAKEIGFDYYQGFFFCKPEILKDKDISATNHSLLQIMVEINKKTFDFNKLEQIISRDVSMSYKLLRYINSAFFRTRHEIATIKQALLYLGQKEIKRFVSLIAMSKIASQKPEELVRMSCIKAKFLEKLGTFKDQPTADELFTIGLFSNIDALLDQSMDFLMKKLPLAERIKDVLRGDEGDYESYLSLVNNYEIGNWAEVQEACEELSIEDDEIPSIYFEACKWADELTA